MHTVRDRCRGCAGRNLERFLELGPQPPANALLGSPAEFDTEATFPLGVWFCADCTLVQVLDVIDPEVLFSHYLYVTGTSSTMARHNAAHAETVVAALELTPGSAVVEVASNDGSLLLEYKRHGMTTLGIEPALNIARMAVEGGVPTLARFFGREVGVALRLERGPAKVALANNVLAHVDDTRGFLSGLRELVYPEGTVIVEVPALGELVDRLEYDTVYHEHLCYFSAGALAELFNRVGLAISRIDDVSVHGGSLRVWASPCDIDKARHAPAVGERIAAERAAGLASIARFRRFADDVAANRDALVGLLRRLRDAGAVVAAYGAPAKGNTLLNYCGIGTDLVAFTVDKNPLKVGRFTPGRHLPIEPVERIAERRPDYLLILPWNIAEEIMAQEADFRRSGGKFILPVPEPRIV